MAMRKMTVCMMETPPKPGYPCMIITGSGREIFVKHFDEYKRCEKDLLQGEKAVGWLPLMPSKSLPMMVPPAQKVLN